MRRHTILVLVLALALSSNAFGIVAEWACMFPADPNITNMNNWNPTTWTVADDIGIDNTSTSLAPYNAVAHGLINGGLSGSAFCNRLHIGYAKGGTGKLSVESDAQFKVTRLRIGSGSALDLMSVPINGLLEINGGTIVSTKEIALGMNGSGTIKINGGELGWNHGYSYYLYVGSNTNTSGTAHVQLNGGIAQGSRIDFANNGTMDIAGGKLILYGGDGEDQTPKILNAYQTGKLTAYGGLGVIRIEHDVNPASLAITVTAIMGPNQPPAWNPAPSDLAEDIPLDTDLSWAKGHHPVNGFPVSHDVYLGTSYNDVLNASDPNVLPGRGRQTSLSFDPGTLQRGQTYYWRIDEIYIDAVTHNRVVVKGSVWNFVATQGMILEDFESYTSTRGLLVDGPWKDLVGSETSLQIGGSHLGNNSVKITYDTTYAPYKRGAVRTFAAPVNFLSNPNYKALILWFKGAITNVDAVPMYVLLEDSVGQVAAVAYDSAAPQNNPFDAHSIRGASWQIWNMPYQSFKTANSSLNLSSIKKLTLRIGDGVTPGGVGSLCFDDISINVSRCLGYPYLGDIALPSDCKANCLDFTMLAQDWHKAGYTNSQAGNGILDTDFPTDNSQWVSGKINRALKMDGINDWVDVNDVLLTDFQNRTITMWFKRDNDMHGHTNQVFGTVAGDTKIYITLDDSGYLTATYGNAAGNQIASAVTQPDTWYHIAYVLENVSGGLCNATLYLNGFNLTWGGAGINMPRHYGPLTGACIGAYNNGETNFGNTIVDDFRIYGYPLSAAEIGGLAGETSQPSTTPLLWYTFDETSGLIAANSGTLGSVYVPYEGLADINNDSIVDFKDLAIFSLNWLDKVKWPQ